MAVSVSDRATGQGLIVRRHAEEYRPSLAKLEASDHTPFYTLETESDCASIFFLAIWPLDSLNKSAKQLADF
jgi:hypothetical protein